MRLRLVAAVLAHLALLAGCGSKAPESAGPSAEVPAQSPQAGRVDRHPYFLDRDQYLHLVVRQRGIDVVLRFLDPQGSQLLRVDSPNGTEGPEEVFLVAQATGSHVLEVEATDGDGTYDVHVEALRAATPQDRTRAEAAAAYSRGREFERMSESDPAAESYGKAAMLWAQAGREGDQAWSLYRLGKILSNIPNRRSEGIVALDRSSGLFRNMEDRHQEGMSLYHLGLAQSRSGAHASAIRSYEQALSVWEDVANLSEMGTCLNDLAILHVRQGRLHEATDLYSRSIGVWETRGIAGTEEATTRTNLGLLYATFREGGLALTQYHRALAQLATLSPSFAVVDQQAVTLNKLGDTLLWMEGPEPALEKLHEALELRRRLHNVFGQAVTLNSIGLAYLKADRPLESLSAFRSAVETFERLDDMSALAVALINLGTAYDRLGQFREARDSYEKGLSHNLHGPEEMTALLGLARIERSEGRIDEAERRVEQSLALAEGIRGRAWRPDLRTSFHAAQQDDYGFLISLLAERHRQAPNRDYAERAFTVSERSRARSLLDLLSAARARPDPDQIRRLESLSRQVNSHHRNQQTSPLTIRESVLEFELAGSLESWRQANVDVHGPLPSVTAALSLQEAQRELDENTLLLEYFFDDEQGYLWAVTPATMRFVSTLPGRESLESVARQAHALLSRSHLETEEAAARHAAARLSRIVLAPVADLLDRQRLVVVAHGALLTVPFSALPHPDDPDRPLIVDHEVVHLPSVSVLAALRSQRAFRRPAEGLLAVVADPVLGADDERLEPARHVAKSQVPSPGLPRLPYAGLEAQEILRLAGLNRSLAATGFEASRALAESGRLGRYRLLHFATHGQVDDTFPELSSLTLSAFDPTGRTIDGLLRAYEISGLDLSADLVVLSACRSALGMEVGGEGLVGLTQAFLHAGATRLVASFWDVDDRATNELMRRFYTGLLRDQLPPAVALRQAQISMWAEGRWRAPSYWAAFVLQGEWR